MYSPRTAAEKIIKALQAEGHLADITIKDLKSVSLDEFLVTAEIVYSGARIDPFELVRTLREHPKKFGLARRDADVIFPRYDAYFSQVPQGYIPALTKAHNLAAHEGLFIGRTNLAGALQEILDEESLSEITSQSITLARTQLILLEYSIKKKEDSYAEIPEEKWCAYFGERKRSNQARQEQLRQYSFDIKDLARQAFEALINLGKAHRQG